MPSKWYGEDIKKWMNENYDKRVGQAGDVIKKELKDILSRPGRTITYISKYGNKKTKVGPSLPGQPPAKQSGALKKSVFKKVLRRKNVVRVGARGRALNAGVPSIHIDPRPFLAPAMNNSRAEVTKILTDPLPETKTGDAGNTQGT